MNRVVGVAWSALVWVLLWGTFTPLSVAGGVVVGVVVAAVFGPARGTGTALPVRVLPLLRLAGYLLVDLVASTGGVSWQVLRYGPAARGAVVALPLFTTSERVVTAMANAISLAPGTMVLEIDLEAGVWYVYTLGPRDRAGVERARRRVLDTQRRVLRALDPGEVAR